MPGSSWWAEGLPREVTPLEVYLRRREILKAMLAAPLLVAGGACQSGAAADGLLEPPRRWRAEAAIERREEFAQPPAGHPERRTAERVAASHNNYYEFLPGRGGFAFPATRDYEVEPWKVEVTGACHRPRTFDLDDLDRLGREERVYAFRCVERWAMNVPWVGFPLRRLLERVQPTGSAHFVRFVSAARPEQMPGLRPTRGRFPWPYHEGLRIDEATNELAFVATGMYGHPLLKQNGAPLRLALPWKYGFKGPKAVVRIELVEHQPPTFWGRGRYAHENGFLSNVNPNIPHPRWSQEYSYWLGSSPREVFRTPLFNGYGRYVASLYPDEPRSPVAPLRPGQRAR